MKNINHFRFLNIVVCSILISFFLSIACTNTSLEKDHIHQATKTVAHAIDSLEAKIHTETVPVPVPHDKEVHGEVTSTPVPHDKEVHEEVTSTPVPHDKEVHGEVAPISDKHKEKAVPIATKDKVLTEAPYIINQPNKNDLLRSYVSWTQFFITAFGLFLLYFLLRFSRLILTNTQYLGNVRLPLLSSIERILIFYEPIVILLLGSAFVLINPVSHGLCVALLFVAGFSHVKNYISGRILQLDKGMSIGNRIKVDNQKGVISAIDRLGIQLTTDKGIQYLNYSKLSDNGFMLLSGEEIGGNYNLKVSPKEYNERLNYPAKLMDVFATTPFLDWGHRPKIGQPSGEQHTMNVKVMVREDGHLPDLLQLIEERGFVCSIK